MRTSRIHQPADTVLFRTPPGNVGAQGDLYVDFTVVTPSARVLNKIALVFWNEAGELPLPIAFPLDVTCGMTVGPLGLLMWTADLTPSGRYAPTADLFGSLRGLVEQSIPLDLTMDPGGAFGTAGVSVDVQGGQDAVQGRLHVPACPGYSGENGINLSLRVRYELVGPGICEDEWEYLLPLMQVSAPDAITFIEGGS